MSSVTKAGTKINMVQNGLVYDIIYNINHICGEIRRGELAWKNIYTKSKENSPQKTLLERRMKALELAVQAIDDLSNN